MKKFFAQARWLVLSLNLLIVACGGGGGPSNQAPVARISANPEQGAFPLNITFDASGSTDDAVISSYRWSFPDGQSATGVRVEKIFSERGTFSVTLVVTDAAGLTGSASKSINILNNEPPEVDVTFSVKEGIVPLEVAMNAGGTRDPEGRSLNFEWDFGDGNTTTGATVSHLFDAADDYTVRLIVKDDVNEVSRSETVQVRLPDSIGVSGDVRLGEANLIDADTNDPRQVSSADNNTCNSSQRITAPSSVGGFVAQAPTARGDDRFFARPDRFDAYRTTLPKGAEIELFIDDFEQGGVDNPRVGIGLLSGDCQEYLVANVDPVGYKKITVPEDGEYFIVTEAQRGSAGYVIRVGTPLAEANISGNEVIDWETQIPRFVDDELILSFSDKKSATAARSKMGQASYAGAIMQAAPVGEAVVRIRLNDAKKQVLMTGDGNSAGSQAVSSGGDTRTLAEAFNVRYRSEALKNYVELSEIAARLQGELRAVTSELHFLAQPFLIPSDPLYAAQKWHYDMVNLPQAWDRYLGANRNRTVVAVIDSGAYLAHPDLASNLIPGYDFLENDELDGDGPDANPDDPGYTDGLSGESAPSHGTHVAGTVAAVTDNGVGLSGVAGLGGTVKVMPIRVCGITNCPYLAIYNAILYAAGETVLGVRRAERVDVINLSLGGTGFCPGYMQSAVNVARRAGVIVVAAAGNDFDRGNPSSSPANCEGVIGVGALGPSERRAIYSQVQDYVDIAAPGGDVSLANSYRYPAVASTDMQLTANGRVPSYTSLQGTSMAAPHVAGSIGLMRSVWPQLSPEEFDGLLASGRLTRPVGERTDTARSKEFGFGVLDVSKSVATAVSGATQGVLDYLVPQPSAIDFGTSVSQRLVDIVKRGDARVASAELATGARWLSLEQIEETTDRVRYRLTVNRDGLVGGGYGVLFRVTASDGARIDIPVTMRVNSAPAEVFSVQAYVLVYDPQERETIAFQSVRLNDQNEVDFAVLDVTPSKDRYLLIAGSDSDNDRVICEIGDLCNAWPLIPQLVGIQGDRDSRDSALRLGFESRVVDGSPTTLQILRSRSPSVR